MLPLALHGYRTTARTSTGETPYSLVYDMEAVLPIEVKILSLRIIKDAGLNEEDWIQTRLDQLNLIDDKKAYCYLPWSNVSKMDDQGFQQESQTPSVSSWRSSDQTHHIPKR